MAPLQTGDPFEVVSAVGVILYLQSVRVSHRPAFTRRAENASCLLCQTPLQLERGIATSLPQSWSGSLLPRSLVPVLRQQEVAVASGTSNCLGSRGTVLGTEFCVWVTAQRLGWQHPSWIFTRPFL